MGHRCWWSKDDDHRRRTHDGQETGEDGLEKTVLLGPAYIPGRLTFRWSRAVRRRRRRALPRRPWFAPSRLGLAVDDGARKKKKYLPPGREWEPFELTASNGNGSRRRPRGSSRAARKERPETGNSERNDARRDSGRLRGGAYSPSNAAASGRRHRWWCWWWW